MNKNYLYVLPLALAMVAFSGQSVAQGKDPECKGDPQAPMVTLNLNSGKATPKCALVHLGSTIVFRLVPNNDLGAKVVRIEPKNPLHSWVQGTNDHFRSIIVIVVPGQHDPNKTEYQYSDYEYNVIIDDVEYDPRIQVEH